MNGRPNFEQIHVRVRRIPTWKILLFGALILGLGIMLAFVALGVLLVTIPIVLISAAAYRLFGSGRPRRGPDHGQRPASGNVIEGEYTLERDDPDRDRR